MNSEQTINATIRKRLKAVLKNKSSIMGNYYPEDDWFFEAYGESEEELANNIIYEIFNDHGHFCFGGIDVYESLEIVFQYENITYRYCFKDEKEWEIDREFSFYYAIERSEKYLSEIDAIKKAEDADREKRRQEEAAKREEFERKEYIRLKEKYEKTND
jgi:hypothetical protein